MAVTVNANGLSVVHQGSGGEANATLPDVCLTTIGKSVVPIPYGNNAKSADLADGSTTVSMDGGNSIALKGSKFSKSSGDAGGDKKGISSGTIEAEAEFISASPTVMIEGKGVCRLSDQMTMNKANTMCMGGVQNPSVSVSPDQEGTYSVEVTCRYPTGMPLANAPYLLLAKSGATLGAGALDSNGSGVVGGLPREECKLQFKESPDDYTPYRTLAENCPTNLYEEDESYFSALSGRRVPFWRKRSGIGSDWGILTSSSFTDDDFYKMVKFESQLTAPYVVSTLHFSQFADAFVSALDHIQTDKESLDKYQPLAEWLLEMCHENGDILRMLYQADAFEPPAILFAKLRHYGTGASIRYVQFLLWTVINNQLCSYLDTLVVSLDTRLGYMQHQAELAHFTLVEDGIKRYRMALNTLNKAIPDIFSQIFETTNDKLIGISALASQSIVTNIDDVGFSTTVGEINALVYTQENRLNSEPIVSFEDLYSN